MLIVIKLSSVIGINTVILATRKAIHYVIRLQPLT